MIQGLGWLGFAAAMSRFFARDLRMIRLLGIFSQCFWIGHFILLARPLAAGMSLIAALRSAALLTPIGWGNRRAVALCAGLAVLANVGLTWGPEGLALAKWSWLSPVLLAAMAAGITADIQKTPQAYRIGYLVCDFFWFVHNVIVGSHGGMATSATLFAVNAWQLWRMRASARAA